MTTNEYLQWNSGTTTNGRIDVWDLTKDVTSIYEPSEIEILKARVAKLEETLSKLLKDESYAID